MFLGAKRTGRIVSWTVLVRVLFCLGSREIVQTVECGTTSGHIAAFDGLACGHTRMAETERGLVIRSLVAATACYTVTGDIKARWQDGALLWELRRFVALALPSRGALNLCKIIKQSSWDVFLRLFELEIILSRKSASARGGDTRGLHAEHQVSTAAMLLILLHGSVNRHIKKDKELFTAVLIGVLTCTGASQVDMGKKVTVYARQLRMHICGFHVAAIPRGGHDGQHRTGAE
eukprot:6482662-Amphidinium_carterae.1